MTQDSLNQRIVSVLIPIPSDFACSYLVPEGIEVRVGSIVRVPLKSRFVFGVVWDDLPQSVDPKKLRNIDKVFDCPGLDEKTRRFLDRFSSWTLCPRGLVTSMFLSMPSAFEPQKLVEVLRRNPDSFPKKMTSARQRVLDYADQSLPLTRSALACHAGVSICVVDALLKQGIFERVMVAPVCKQKDPNPHYTKPQLTEAQKKAACTLNDMIVRKSFEVSLLDGVTGSGKTEVYFEAIAKVLEQGRQILILLPEIALTCAFLDRFASRFGVEPAQWHSGLSDTIRQKTWRQVAEGTFPVVVGVRSSLFLPFKDLGLIIVDEEHDSSYKQEDRLFYNARDMAVFRAFTGNFPIILASATPSVESQVNVLEGRYARVPLPSRFSDAPMPDIVSVDMRSGQRSIGSFLSPALVEEVKERLSKGEQSLLFLNRRGYAPLTLCNMCGEKIECIRCSASMVEHRSYGRLLCHYCGYSIERPASCSVCDSVDSFIACGPGIERIAEEVSCRFPKARMTVFSSDVLGNTNRMQKELEAITRGEIDIIIGTQMIAKGHNFPNITLVGIIDADPGLIGGDPRCSERMFQLLNQVIGRAGRAGKKSLGILQTYQPDHPIIKAILSGDACAFYAREIEERKRNAMPPFGRLAAIIVRSRCKQEAQNYARLLRNSAPISNHISVFGPAEAPLAVIRGEHRIRLLVHGKRHADIQTFVRSMLEKSPSRTNSIRVQIDIDPRSFF